MTLFALVRSLKRQHASQVAGFAAVTIAGAVLIGWWEGLPMLSSWGSTFVPTKPVAALCLTALGLALVHPGKNSRFALAVGLAVATIAVLDLFGVDFGINRWLVPRAAAPGPGAASFEMINGMPLAIALAAGSLALSRFEGHHFTATVLAGHAARAADRRRPALYRRRYRFAGRNDARTSHGATVVAAAAHARMRDHCAAPVVRRVHGSPHRRRAAPPRSERPDE